MLERTRKMWNRNKMLDLIAAQIKAYKDYISTEGTLPSHNHVLRIFESMRIELVAQGSEFNELKELFFLALNPKLKTLDDARTYLETMEAPFSYMRPPPAPVMVLPSCELKLIIRPKEDGGIEYIITSTTDPGEIVTEAVPTLDAAFKELREAADFVVAEKLAEWMKEQPA